MGGNEAGHSMTQHQATNPKQPGSQPGNDWGSDQQKRDQQKRDRQVETNRHPVGSPDDSPMQDEEEVGTTKSPGSEGTTRY